jgi:Septum formation
MISGVGADSDRDCNPAWRCKMRCLECGAESDEAAQVCARCGAPIARQVSVGADPAAGGSGDPIAPPASDGPHQPAGQRPEPSARRTALVLACLGLILLVAVTALVWSVTKIIVALEHSGSSASSAPATGSSTSSAVAATGRLTIYQLRAGDCLRDNPGLYLGTGSQWPDYFNVVSCPQRHTAEVFFAGNAWPSGLAYPGDNKVESQADARCSTAFLAYDGIGNSQSNFTYDYSRPDNIAWANGDRWLLCIAYEATQQYPGGVPVNFSIDGSQK